MNPAYPDLAPASRSRIASCRLEKALHAPVATIHTRPVSFGRKSSMASSGEASADELAARSLLHQWLLKSFNLQLAPKPISGAKSRAQLLGLEILTCFARQGHAQIIFKLKLQILGILIILQSLRQTNSLVQAFGTSCRTFEKLLLASSL